MALRYGDHKFLQKFLMKIILPFYFLEILEIMKKIIITIFSLIAVIFLSAFGYSSYQYYKALHIDDPIQPYLSATK